MNEINRKLNKNTFFTDSVNEKIQFNTISIIIIYFCLYLSGLFLGRLIYNEIANILINQLEVTQSLVDSLRKVIICGFQILLFILWVKFVEKRSIKTMGFRARNPILNYSVGMIVGFLAIVIITITLVMLEYVEIKGVNSSYSPVLFVLIAISWVFQSSAEEIAIRGYLIPKLGLKSTPLNSILITSIIFGILHLFTSGVTVLSFLNLILSGAFFALIAIYSNNIWAVMGLHFMWNLTLGNIFGFPVSGFSGYGKSIFLIDMPSESFFTGGAFGPEGGFITTIILLIGIFVIGFKLFKKYK